MKYYSLKSFKLLKRLPFRNCFLLIIILFLNISCSTSMTPLEINNKLPNLTKSKFISTSTIENDVKEGKCKYLVKSRKYTSPIGFTVDNDLKYGAKGIDEWVQIDGGNAYFLKNYDWITVDHNGTTQLVIEFDTMLCNE